MPLPRAAESRQLKHRRSLSVQAYARGDGLWEIDARVTDVKTRPVTNVARVLPAGEPIHDLLLRLIIDERFNILESGAESLAVPYPGHCGEHGDTYGLLAGLNLMSGFKRAVRERIGGVAGCTHLTELADVLPTAVVQAFAGDVIDTRGTGDTRPFQLDRCHALATDGEVVRLHYPRWYQTQVKDSVSKLSQNPAPAGPTQAPLPSAHAAETPLSHPGNRPGRRAESGQPAPPALSPSPPAPVLNSPKDLP